MKIVRFILVSLMSATYMAALAEDDTATLSEEQYRQAIASFGVSDQVTKAASKEAVKLVEEQRQADKTNESYQMKALPADLLDRSPY